MKPVITKFTIRILIGFTVLGFGTGCDSKREERSIKKVKGLEVRIEDYRQSHFFDRALGELAVGLQKWNTALGANMESQQGMEKEPILNNSLDPIMPILKEAQRGFFKKGGKGWKKEIRRLERLSADKEIFLETIRAEIETTSGAKNNPWHLTALGRYPKDQSGELFDIQWRPQTQELKIESLQKSEAKLSCVIRFRDQGVVDEASCVNFVLFRFDNKDVNLSRLSYSLKKGFSGEGKITTSKGVTEKWSFPVVSTDAPVPSGEAH